MELSGITTNAIILSAYAIGNAAGPFMWKKQYQPRYAALLLFTPHPLSLNHLFPSNHVPWAIIAAAIGSCAILILILRFMLYSENKRRDGEQRDETYDDVYITQEKEDGTKSVIRVDKVWINYSNSKISVIAKLCNKNPRLSSTLRTFRTVISATRYRRFIRTGSGWRTT